MSILGADVSGWQPGNVNMAGLDFVYVKATQGIYKVNANHDAQVAEARSLGLIVGHYHFPAWGDPVQEAQAFIIGSQWQSGDFMVLDIENSVQTPWPADPVSWCVAFENEVYRQLTIWCMDYAGPNVRAGWNWAPLAALGGGLIDPEYNPVGPSSSAPWANVAMWQNADTNQTGGDSDVFYGDRAALTAYGTPGQVTAQGGGITPITEGFLMALTDDQQARVLAAADRINGVVTDPVAKILTTNDLPAIGKAVLTTAVPWYGFNGLVPTTGRQTTNLSLLAGWADTSTAGLAAGTTAAGAKVDALAAQVDPTAINAAITAAVNAVLPGLVASAVAAAVAANPPAAPTVDVNAIAEAVFQRQKAQENK